MTTEYNYWGDSTGPYHDTLNPGGLGDTVQGIVDFIPWLNEPAVCGDVDGNGMVTPADGYILLNYLGAGPPPITCWAANADGQNGITPQDGYWILNYLGVGPDLNCQLCEF